MPGKCSRSFHACRWDRSTCLVRGGCRDQFTLVSLLCPRRPHDRRLAPGRTGGIWFGVASARFSPAMSRVRCEAAFALASHHQIYEIRGCGCSSLYRHSGRNLERRNSAVGRFRRSHASSGPPRARHRPSGSERAPLAQAMGFLGFDRHPTSEPQPRKGSPKWRPRNGRSPRPRRSLPEFKADIAKPATERLARGPGPSTRQRWRFGLGEPG